MLVIEHRKNKIEELQGVSSSRGVEIDVRSDGDRLVLHHEPFCQGEDFEKWLAYYHHSFLVLNVKEEGIEKKIIELISRRGISGYFFLDLSFPFLVKLMNAGEKKIAIRYSEYESIETCLKLIGKVEWVWVDCFQNFPLDKTSYEKLSKYFKICLVSPELVGRAQDIEKFKRDMSGMKIDGVCTKFPERWF